MYSQDCDEEDMQRYNLFSQPPQTVLSTPNFEFSLTNYDFSNNGFDNLFQRDSLQSTAQSGPQTNDPGNDCSQMTITHGSPERLSFHLSPLNDNAALPRARNPTLAHPAHIVYSTEYRFENNIQPQSQIPTQHSYMPSMPSVQPCVVSSSATEQNPPAVITSVDSTAEVTSTTSSLHAADEIIDRTPDQNHISQRISSPKKRIPSGSASVSPNTGTNTSLHHLELTTKVKPQSADAVKARRSPKPRKVKVSKASDVNVDDDSGASPWRTINAAINLKTAIEANEAENRHVEQQWTSYHNSSKKIKVPETDSDKLPYVAQVKGAMLNCNDVDDRVSSGGQLTIAFKRFSIDGEGEHHFSDELVEIQCWKIVNEACDRHCGIRKLSEQFRRYGSDEHQSQKYLKFDNFVNIICESLYHNKALCVDQFHGHSILYLVDAPIHERKRKQSNAKSNALKNQDNEIGRRMRQANGQAEAIPAAPDVSKRKLIEPRTIIAPGQRSVVSRKRQHSKQAEDSEVETMSPPRKLRKTGVKKGSVMKTPQHMIKTVAPESKFASSGEEASRDMD